MNYENKMYESIANTMMLYNTSYFLEKSELKEHELELVGELIKCVLVIRERNNNFDFTEQELIEEFIKVKLNKNDKKEFEIMCDQIQLDNFTHSFFELKCNNKFFYCLCNVLKKWFSSELDYLIYGVIYNNEKCKIDISHLNTKDFQAYLTAKEKLVKEKDLNILKER